MRAVHSGVRVWKSLEPLEREERQDGGTLMNTEHSCSTCGHQQDAVDRARGEASLGQGCGWSPRMLASWGLGSFEDGPLNLTQEVQGRHKKHLLLLKPRQGEHMVWVVLCSPKSSVEVLTPGYPWIWLHLETGCIADVKVKMRSYYSRVGPWSNMIGILIIGEETHRRKRAMRRHRLIGKTPRDDRGRDWNGVAISQGMPRPPLEGRWVSEGTWSCQHLDFGLLAPRTMREDINYILSHQPVVLCSSSAGKLVQHESILGLGGSGQALGPGPQGSNQLEQEGFLANVRMSHWNN